MKHKTPKSGRIKGVPNRLTQEKRQMLSDFIDRNFEDFEKAYNTLKPLDRCKIFVDLLKFVVPPASYVLLDTEFSGPTINESLKELAEECYTQMEQQI